MQNILKTAQPNDMVFGFRLIKSEYVKSKNARLYTLRHEKTGASLLYFDRKDENKTFCIGFKTLPEDDTGVFHILEHSVLNGSEKYPVKEPFVSMLQSSMQTFLNALTYSDKTVFPVSSRNEQDFFNLMSVYLDAVFRPLIYKKPEIFMQEGWHYEFDEESGEAYYNGVVFSEMKGAYADVDRLIEDEADRLLFPDSSYGFSSGGHPEHIPELSYEKFIAAHRRFYHPSNARIFLDGAMDIDSVLGYIDSEYLSGYERREPDFDFVRQMPVSAEKTICYEAQEGEEDKAHMAVSKILCMHSDTVKIYAAQILTDYLAGSNEAPLKRAVLEQGLAQDVSLSVAEGVYQPVVSAIFRNTLPECFTGLRSFLPDETEKILAQGINYEALSAALERAEFSGREITEPYGVELALKAFDGWLYGDDPLTHIETEGIFSELREKLGTGYFEDLMREMFADMSDKVYLYALPNTKKGEHDAENECARLEKITASWDEARLECEKEATGRMQQWQQSADSDEVLSMLPHLELTDISAEVKEAEKQLCEVSGVPLMRVDGDTNGIVYMNMYFNVSDFSADELRLLNVLVSCFGELRTENYAADVLQSRVKATLGALGAKIELISKAGDTKTCTPYLLISASALEEKAPAAVKLLTELLVNGRYDETDRIYETVLQTDYFMKQSLINEGHMYAITKALSAFTAEGALRETLEGESFVRWFSTLAERFEENSDACAAELEKLAAKAFAKSRLFVGCCGNADDEAFKKLIDALPENELGAPSPCPEFDSADTTVSIPGGVGFSALGHNLYALGGEGSGAWQVMTSLVSYVYLWNEIRVRGGAYGTGMSVRENGDMFCYSYRDPNTDNSRSVYDGIADFIEDFLEQSAPLDDIIIGAVNAADPLLDPAGVCAKECAKHLRGTPDSASALKRRQILETNGETLARLCGCLREYAAKAKFCTFG